MGEVCYGRDEWAKNSCMLCQYFESYEDFYYDELEPEDMGFCKELMFDGHTDAGKTCDKFNPKGGE